MHLLREGQFETAATFLRETTTSPPQAEQTAATGKPSQSLHKDQGVELLRSEDMRAQFSNMYHILHELKDHHNLIPAIAWARSHSEVLESRGSNLEFELGRLQFVWLFQGGDARGSSNPDGPQRALEYARREFGSFKARYLQEIQQLMGAMAFSSNLQGSPYRTIFYNDYVWDEVANSFTREFCSLLGLSADSPLYIAATAGAIALPTLLKLQKIMEVNRTEWTTQDELPVSPFIPSALTDSNSLSQVETPLPPSYQFHSIFVCPVSKEQTTDLNPPMMLPCGHVIANDSMKQISKSTRFKCPYCPCESHPKDARKVVL